MAPCEPMVMAASSRNPWRSWLHGLLQAVGPVQRLGFLDIGEDVVDGLAPHQVEELVAVAVDAERIGQRDRRRQLVLVGELRRDHEGLLRLGRVRKILPFPCR